MGRNRRGAHMRGTIGLLALGVLLVGCTGGADPVDSTQNPASSESPAPSASASPSPSSSLTPAEQTAFEEATAVVLAYRQTIADLYSGARTDLNDLDKVATGELLNVNLQGVQQGLAQGRRSEPLGAELQLVSGQLVSADLASDPPEVRVRACVDSTAVTDVSPEGFRTPGTRESLDYVLVQTDYLPEPGWAVVKVEGRADAGERTC